jgi:hypothetical protein
MARVNYLNNRDLLAEIHKSKTSYCSYKTERDVDYDMILKNVDQIVPKNIKKAKKARAERLCKLAHEQAVKIDPTAKLDKNKIKPKDITDTELVFRIMTWEHIPVDKVKMAAMDAEEPDDHTEYDGDVEPVTQYIKVNFPPFQHYRIDKNGIPKCVAKSHWTGTLSRGQFCKDHGKMTNKLALMFMKLCERYGTRSNWRGYTYNDEMRSQALLQLSQIGLQFDESKSNNPFAYYTAVITNSFTRVLNVEKRNQNLRDDILEMNNFAPSYTRQMNWHGGSGNIDD